MAGEHGSTFSPPSPEGFEQQPVRFLEQSRRQWQPELSSPPARYYPQRTPFAAIEEGTESLSPTASSAGVDSRQFPAQQAVRDAVSHAAQPAERLTDTQSVRSADAATVLGQHQLPDRVQDESSPPIKLRDRQDGVSEVNSRF